MFNVLMKKYFIELFSVFKRDKKKADWLGVTTTAILIVAFIVGLIFVLSTFAKQYTDVRFHNVQDVETRQYELLTLIYSVLLVVGVFSGVKYLNFSIFESSDKNILITLPIKSSVLFASKLAVVYIRQFAFTAITILTTNLTFGIVNHLGAYYIGMSVVMCFIFPLITISISSVFCLPVYFLKRLIQSRYVTYLILITAAMGIIFWGYSEILAFVQTLVTTGEVKFLFNERTMLVIMDIVKYSYPCNMIANILLGRNVGESIGIFLAILVGVTAIGFVIVQQFYVKAIHVRTFEKTGFNALNKNFAHKRRTRFHALLEKEFLLVLRTPSYAFQYFSVAITMPLMVFFCMDIGSDLLSGLIMVESNFELALFLVLVFGGLTNTFCATNISREGPAFCALKSTPIPWQEFIGVKVLFCSIVTVISMAASVILVYALGYLLWWEALVLFFIALILSEAQICFATRKDLDRPNFSEDDDCEVRESNTTVSTIVIATLLTSAVIGGISLYASIFYGNYRGQDVSDAIIGIAFAVAGALLAVCVTYLCVGIEKKFKQLTGGN